MSMETKTCTNCNKLSPMSEFKNAKMCAKCSRKKQKIYQKKYYQKKKAEKLKKKLKSIQQKMLENSENIEDTDDLKNVTNKLKKEALDVEQQLKITQNCILELNKSNEEQEKNSFFLKKKEMEQKIQERKEIARKYLEIKQKEKEAKQKEKEEVKADSKMKKCINCDMQKPISEYYTYQFNDTRRHFNQCKQCMYKKQKARYHANPHIKRNKVNYNLIRDRRMRVQAHEISKLYNRLKELNLIKDT